MRIAIPADDRLVAEISDVALADATIADIFILAAVTGCLAGVTIYRAAPEEAQGAGADEITLAQLARLTRRQRRHGASALIADLRRILAAVAIHLAGGRVVAAADIAQSASGEELITALHPVAATCGPVDGAAPFAGSVARLARWAREARLAASPALLVADLLHIQAETICAAGVAPGPASATPAVRAADFSACPTLSGVLLRGLDARAVLARAAAILALPGALLLFLLLFGVQGGNAGTRASSSQHRGQQSTPRVGKTTQDLIKQMAVHGGVLQRNADKPKICHVR